MPVKEKRVKKRSNPHGANQHKPDPRQAEFLKYYLDPKSETFSNAKQSALRVGYSEEYSDQILAKDLDWLAENVRYEDIIRKAERNLKEFMDEKDKRIRADMTKFALERLKKDKFSTRKEMTGRDGKDLPVPLLVELEDVPNNDSSKEDTES